jgi:hypothetical protein
VKEYTDKICLRDENAAEITDTTTNSTATPTGRSSNAHNNNKLLLHQAQSLLLLKNTQRYNCYTKCKAEFYWNKMECTKKKEGC